MEWYVYGWLAGKLDDVPQDSLEKAKQGIIGIVEGVEESLLYGEHGHTYQTESPIDDNGFDVDYELWWNAAKEKWYDPTGYWHLFNSGTILDNIIATLEVEVDHIKFNKALEVLWDGMRENIVEALCEEFVPRKRWGNAD